MNPRFVLAALLLGVPLLEIYLFIKVGGAIGALPTIALVVLTAVIGAALVRAQGIATLRRAQATLDRDELPAFELLEGVALLIGGALLLMPGFFTDAVGFLCVWPVSRRALLRALMPRVRIIAGSNVRRPRSPHGATGRIIEGEYTRRPDK